MPPLWQFVTAQTETLTLPSEINSLATLAPGMQPGQRIRAQEIRMTQLDQRLPPERGRGVSDTGTAETDENYDLVSVLYHCLKAADACTQYVADAEDAGDDELVDFFERARQLQNRLAREARELLAQRMADAATNDEES